MSFTFGTLVFIDFSILDSFRALAFWGMMDSCSWVRASKEIYNVIIYLKATRKMGYFNAICV